jgi:4-hydroxybenzoate polyprenyltransferase
VTLRPYLFFVSGAAGLVGLAGAPPLPLPACTLALFVFFVSYGLGQALTDVFQTDTDSLSSPYRPLVRGEISRGAVLLVSLSGLLLCGLTLALFNPWNLALAAAAVAGLAAYTPLKRRWWGGPPCNAAVMALLPAMGYLCAEPSPRRAADSPILPLAMGSVFASYAVFVLLGYLKDVEADRATGYATIAVRFGRRAAVVASGAFCAVSLAASLLLLGRVPWSAASRWPGVALWLAGAILLVAAHVKALSVRKDAEAFPAIALSVLGFLALHLGEASVLRPALAPLAAGLLVLFEATLARRPCREQI